MIDLVAQIKKNIKVLAVVWCSLGIAMGLAYYVQSPLHFVRVVVQPPQHVTADASILPIMPGIKYVSLLQSDSFDELLKRNGLERGIIVNMRPVGLDWVEISVGALTSESALKNLNLILKSIEIALEEKVAEKNQQAMIVRDEYAKQLTQSNDLLQDIKSTFDDKVLKNINAENVAAGAVATNAMLALIARTQAQSLIFERLDGLLRLSSSANYDIAYGPQADKASTKKINLTGVVLIWFLLSSFISFLVIVSAVAMGRESRGESA